MARRLVVDGGEFYDLPVFYLDSRAQGITSRKQAREVAAKILGADLAEVVVRFEVHSV